MAEQVRKRTMQQNATCNLQSSELDIDCDMPIDFDVGQRISDLDPSTSKIGDQMLEWIMDMQGVWDDFKAPLEMQDKMMKMMFSGIQPTKGRKRLKPDEERKSLVSLLMQKGDMVVEKAIPQNLEQLFSHYRSLGMVEPQRWRLCVGNQNNAHPPKVFSPSKEENTSGDSLRCACPSARPSSRLKRDCHVCCSRCKECGNTLKEMVRFDYISLIDQLKLLCSSNTNCHEFLAMWRQRHAWLGHSNSEEQGRVKDFWDGQKVRLYQDFWNPNVYWELPVICQNPKCKRIYRAFPVSMKSKKLLRNWSEEQQEYRFRCSKCRSWIQSKRNFVKGDPRNFALICHWDGFQAASTKQKDVGVVEMSIANANKGSKVGPLPLLFIPFSLVQLEKKHGDLLQHFLTPLMEELVSAFINGFVVEYNYPSSLIANDLSSMTGGSCTLRAMLMLWTGDHPAQCKLGMLKDGGKNGCRRDFPITTKVVQERRIPFYVYSDNRYQARYPPRKRDVEGMYVAIKASKQEATKKGKERILAEAGLTGESSVWRLYELYGLDVSKDLVYDVMHVLALNLFKKYTKALFEGSSNEVKKLIDASTKEATLAAPKSLRHQGRWPSTSPSKYYTMFTAEEHQKFVMWCLPHVLNRVSSINKRMKDVGMLLIDISHIFYNRTRTHGWSKEDMEVTRSLFSSWRILTEEMQGASASPLEHVAGNAEMLDDILRHGGHDCMWCYKYERGVCDYVAIPTNNKTNEITYAKYQSRVLLTKTKEKTKMEEDGLLPAERLLLSLHACLQKPEGSLFDKEVSTLCEEWHKQGMLVATSESSALSIFKACELLDHCPCKELIEAKGIMVSSKKPRTRRIVDQERVYLQEFWGKDLVASEIIFFAKVFLKAERFCVHDRVIVHYNEHSPDAYALCEIMDFFAHQCCGNIGVFFIGNFSNGGDDISGLPNNEVTGMKVISDIQLKEIYKRILPISFIIHKCFLLPDGAGGDHVIYEMQDIQVRKRLLQPGLPGCIPPWPEIGDIILISVHNNPSHFQHAVVRDVCSESCQVRLGIMCPSAENEWVVMLEDNTWRDWKICLKVLHGWIPTAVVTQQGANNYYQRAIRFRKINV